MVKMLNIEKYKKEILKYSGYQHSLVCLIYEDIMKKMTALVVVPNVEGKRLSG